MWSFTCFISRDRLCSHKQRFLWSKNIYTYAHAVQSFVCFRIINPPCISVASMSLVTIDMNENLLVASRAESPHIPACDGRINIDSCSCLLVYVPSHNQFVFVHCVSFCQNAEYEEVFTRVKLRWSAVWIPNVQNSVKIERTGLRVMHPHMLLWRILLKNQYIFCAQRLSGFGFVRMSAWHSSFCTSGQRAQNQY